jgi:hypothetical protein
MIAVPFDTLKMARKLEASGMTGSMAAGTAEALADALAGADLATKSDVAEVRTEVAALRTELKGDIAGLRTELKGDISALRTELKGDIAGLRSETKFDNASLRADLELLRRDLTIKVGGMMVVAVGIILTAFRYLPPHP